MNVVNTVGEFLLGKLVVEEATRAAAAGAASVPAFIGQFYGGFYARVNLLGFVFQALLVSRVFKYAGIRGALFVLPVVASLSYGLMAFLPVLSVVAFAKTFEKATDYSIQNTARHALFLPTSREAKYKAKQAIDSFFWRAGDLLQAGVVLAGAYLVFGIREYALLNLLFVAAWLVLVFVTGIEYRARVRRESERQVAA